MTSPDPKLVEAVAEALCEVAEAALATALVGPNATPLTWENADERLRNHYRGDAVKVLTAALPTIEAATLKRVAEMARLHGIERASDACLDLADDIRSLIPAPQTQEGR